MLRRACRQLGRDLDALGAAELTTCLAELTKDNQHLAERTRRLIADNELLRARVDEQEAEITASRASLRRMIREQHAGPT